MRDVDSTTARPAPRFPIGIHLAAIYAVVTIGLPLGYVILRALAQIRSLNFLLAIPAAIAVLLLALATTAALTGKGSLLGRSRQARLALAVLVTVGGTALLAYTRIAAEDTEALRKMTSPLFLLLIGVPYVVVAATMVRMPPLAWAARIAVAVVFAGGLVVIWATGPSEVQARVTHAHVDRNFLYTTTIPGYQSTALGQWAPQGSATAHPDITITMQGIPMGDEYFCVPEQQCDREQPDLTYWRSSAAHGYVQRRGTAGVEVRGGLGVNRALLREAVQSARVMTDAEVLQSLPPAPRARGATNWIRSLLPAGSS
jgi:hypothetical protein